MRRALALAAAALVVAACGSTSSGGSGSASPASSKLTGSATIYAAASLTNAFKELGQDFENAHPGTTLTFNFAGSPTLVTQLQQGARADVLATADGTNMDKAETAGLLDGNAAVFVRNRLEIAVAPGNPKNIQGLSDLARSNVILVLAAPAVPAGKYAAQALTAAGVTAHPKSLETDVESVLTKVELGEADAGIVYTTDVQAAGSKVEGITIPDAQNVVANYPIALLKGAPNKAVGQAFLAYVESAAGRALLARYGFQTA